MILDEFTKTIESNDGINTNHELYPDMQNPTQAMAPVKSKKIEVPPIPEGVKKLYDKLQAKEDKGSGKSK